ncbi:hypothetical protein AQ899_22040 [Burkholderia pseudomallei]|nr:hypothetical protein AQ899_22040 [Burkholderia pseudomallei]
MVGACRGPFAGRGRPPAVFRPARGRPPGRAQARQAVPGVLGRGAAERRVRALPPAAAANRSQGATPCRAFLKIDPETVRK